MKPHLLKVPQQPHYSFGIRKEMMPNINNRWHYHPEIELIHFQSGFGTQFVGDHISQFKPGDIVLVGRNLPHFWKYDDAYFARHDSDTPCATVIHFFENFIGERFLHLPEVRHIKQLLEKALQGVLINGQQAVKVAAMMEEVYRAEGINRILALVACLSELAACDNMVMLSSLGFKYDFPEPENKRINAIYAYSLNNFRQKIQLNTVAEIAQLSPNSFCRYFKHHTGKTYSDFLTEIRIGYACKLLIADNASVKQICYESGFNNFSCFHKNFKRITSKTPLSYQEEYK